MCWGLIRRTACMPAHVGTRGGGVEGDLRCPLFCHPHPHSTSATTDLGMSNDAGDEEQLLHRNEDPPSLVEAELPKQALVCLLLQHLSK